MSALEQRKNGGGVILPSAGANLDDDVGICLDAELLIWKAHQTGMNFAVGVTEASNTAATTYSTSSDPYIKPNFCFDPGVRILFGLRPSHDDWQIDASWTNFYTKASTNYDSTQVPVLPLFESHQPASLTTISPSDLSSSVSGVWRANLNFIDLDLSRASFLSKWMSVKPYISVRNLWLYQKYNVSAAFSGSQASVANAQMKSNLWAIGPRGGFELKFGMGEGFYFFNNSSAALLWGFFKNSQNSVETSSNRIYSYPRSVYVHTSTYNFDMSLGLGWDRKIDDNHYRISIRGAWEHHIFFDTNYFKSYADLSFIEAQDSPKGNFTTEGFTLALRFDF
jgi:hypothetical protein